MAEFECSQCGRCCMNLGGYIKIERELGNRRYYCRMMITNDLFIAHVERDHRERFADSQLHEVHPQWCCFLREGDREGTFVCTIYQTRPHICRNYRCYLLRIFNAEGKVIGTVGGKRSLLSKDPDLTGYWNEKITPIRANAEAHWMDQVQETLRQGGYRSERYE
jgi:uncharacterized protein